MKNAGRDQTSSRTGVRSRRPEADRESRGTSLGEGDDLSGSDLDHVRQPLTGDVLAEPLTFRFLVTPREHKHRVLPSRKPGELERAVLADDGISRATPINDDSLPPHRHRGTANWQVRVHPYHSHDAPPWP